MRFIKKHKKIFTLLTAVLLIAVSLGVFAGKAWLLMTHGTVLHIWSLEQDWEKDSTQ